MLSHKSTSDYARVVSAVPQRIRMSQTGRRTPSMLVRVRLCHAAPLRNGSLYSVTFPNHAIAVAGFSALSGSCAPVLWTRPWIQTRVDCHLEIDCYMRMFFRRRTLPEVSSFWTSSASSFGEFVSTTLDRLRFDYCLRAHGTTLDGSTEEAPKGLNNSQDRVIYCLHD